MGVSGLGSVAGSGAVVAAQKVTRFPKPRGIGRDWEPCPATFDRVRAVIDAHIFAKAIAIGEGAIVEARAWRIARGKGRGQVKRIDVAFETGMQFSLRVLVRAYSLRTGEEACR